MDLEAFLSKLDHVRRSGKGFTGRFPGHQDKNNSLSVTKGKDDQILLKCFAGCDLKTITAALGLEIKDLFVRVSRSHTRDKRESVKRPPKSLKNKPSQQNHTDKKPCEGLALAELAKAKKLPANFLASLGLRDTQLADGKAVAIPYLAEDGSETAIRYRKALTGDARFRWRSGAKVSPYGLQRLPDIRRVGWVLLVEGESDCWTAWYHGLTCLGVPGKTNWKKPWAKYLDGVHVSVWQEPGAEDFSQRIGKDLPPAAVIVAPAEFKDISEAHIAGKDVAALVRELDAVAIPVADLLRQQQSDDLNELLQAASPVLSVTDPLDLVRCEFQRLGYGGDLKPAIITYLAVTTRVLKMRMGTMPAHLLLVGPPSIGKSFTVQMVLLLFPPEASHAIESGSPRVLIYDTADLQHRAVLFSESDSLPAGEDNPAASAIRNLLQDHRLHYKVVLRDPDGGEPIVHEISKPGPTVLITTSVRLLGGQLGSRVFTLDVPNDSKRLRDALKAQAQLEISATSEPDSSLIAFQAVLQRMAPLDVLVPFAPRLADFIADAVNAPRILRDFQRLLSFIKAVTIIRHQHRERSEDGRLVATLDDYAVVYELVADMYEAASTGTTENMRKVVDAVAVLEDGGVDPVSFTAVARHLTLHPQQVKREAYKAIRNGWLINSEDKKNRPAKLTLTDAEPLPGCTGLPTPESLANDFTVSHADREDEGHTHEDVNVNEANGFDPDHQFPGETVDEFWARKKAERELKAT
jgi:hypothetical protein